MMSGLKQIDYEPVPSDLDCNLMISKHDNRISKSLIKKGLPHGELCFFGKERTALDIYHDGTSRLGTIIDIYSPEAPRFVPPTYNKYT